MYKYNCTVFINKWLLPGTVSVENGDAVHADICSRCPANKGAKLFKCVIFNTDDMLNMNQLIFVSVKWWTCPKPCSTPQYNPTFQDQKINKIRVTPDSRPKTSLQRVQKPQASSSTLFTRWCFYWSRFHPFCSAIQFKGRKFSCSSQRQLIPTLWSEASSSNCLPTHLQ